jgi:signal transduction histidine kinase
MFRAKPSWAVLEISDNGIGISPEALPHVFERFYRSEQVQARKARGTGLGLSMVLSIVEAHAGKVEVRSRENEGAIFVVRLPRLELTSADRQGMAEPPSAKMKRF